jgi:hypothetical protein
MQTRTYGSLFKLIQSLAGVSAFTTEEQSDISRFINRRFFQAFNESPNWVRYLNPSEQRYVQSDIYEITFNTSGSATSTTTETLKFYWVGMYLGSPVYSCLSTGDGELPFVLYNDVDGTIGSNKGSWVIARSSETGNRSNPVGTTITSFASLNRKFLTMDVELPDGSGITDFKDELPYPNLSKKWYSIGLVKTTNLTVKAAGRNIIPYNEVYSTNSPIAKKEIGEFLRIHNKQALVRDSSHEYSFFVDVAGAGVLNLLSNAESSIHVTYKDKFTPFTTSSSFADSTETVPEEFFAYIAHASYADFLRMDGQHQKAILEEENAKGALELQLERNDIIANNNNATTRFQTYVNSQSR